MMQQPQCQYRIGDAVLWTQRPGRWVISWRAWREDRVRPWVTYGLCAEEDAVDEAGFVWTAFEEDLRPVPPA
jgi:hypothetical protein